MEPAQLNWIATFISGIADDVLRDLYVHPGLDNHGMGTVFEELIRRLNEEAGEH